MVTRRALNPESLGSIPSPAAKKFMTKYYVGCFFFNPKTKKVLLHLRDDKSLNPNLWAFFGGMSEANEEPLQTLKREIKEELNLRLRDKDIKYLCDYFNPDYSQHRYIYFIETENLKDEDIKLAEGAGFGWFTLEQAFKLNLTKRTRQDLETFKQKFIDSKILF